MSRSGRVPKMAPYKKLLILSSLPAHTSATAIPKTICVNASIFEINAKEVILPDAKVIFIFSLSAKKLKVANINLLFKPFQSSKLSSLHSWFRTLTGLCY